MKEEELKEIINKDIKEEPELENIGKMFLGFIDIYNKDIKEAELKGRQSKLKEVLNILERYDYLNNGFIIEIKEQISKELSGVNHSQLRNTDKSVRLNSKPSGGLVSCNPSDTRKGLCKNCGKPHYDSDDNFCKCKKFEVGE